MACSAPVTIKGPMGNISVSCKQCLNCRIGRQSALAFRALLEQRTSLCADFWTLTYATAPDSLDYRDFSLFLKRLRKWNHQEGNLIPIRYLAVGEYGEKSGRGHFHAIIYNSLPTGSKQIGMRQSPHDRKTADLLGRLWPHGFVYIGTVTPASIRYTARYCLKFGSKGQAGMAHWSAKPPLGADCMRQLAEYMATKGGYNLTEPPTHMGFEGQTYRLDGCMRSEFWAAYTGSDEDYRGGALKAHANWLLERRFGDPIEADRRRQEARNYFFETARFVRGEI